MKKLFLICGAVCAVLLGADPQQPKGSAQAVRRRPTIPIRRSLWM